eukprot:scaffold1221_cov207-Amphora_coffeaeformis.AAC.15
MAYSTVDFREGDKFGTVGSKLCTSTTTTLLYYQKQSLESIMSVSPKVQMFLFEPLASETSYPYFLTKNWFYIRDSCMWREDISNGDGRDDQAVFTFDEARHPFWE